MIRALILLVSVLAVSACTQRLICPAYQSAFIYDKEALRRHFSYFKEDATPKVLASRQTKYLVAVPESYRKKLRSLRTVEMKPVYPVIPDSLRLDKDVNLLMAETDAADSAAGAADSVETEYAITKTKEKYNLDQDLYMWYFRKILVMPDVRAAMENKKAQADEKQKAERQAGKKKWRLFGRRDKPDSAGVQVPPTEKSASESKRRPLFGKRKRDDTPPQPKEKQPAKKEDTDDGF
jgi:hypothetical protein